MLVITLKEKAYEKFQTLLPNVSEKAVRTMTGECVDRLIRFEVPPRYILYKRVVAEIEEDYISLYDKDKGGINWIFDIQTGELVGT